MKRTHYTLLAAWLLLFCFIAGQVGVYSHNHHIVQYAGKHKKDVAPNQSISEKCKLCDVMHHTDMLHQEDTFSACLPSTVILHPVVVYDFKSFGLILAGGRSPPIS